MLYGCNFSFWEREGDYIEILRLVWVVLWDFGKEGRGGGKEGRKEGEGE